VCLRTYLVHSTYVFLVMYQGYDILFYREAHCSPKDAQPPISLLLTKDRGNMESEALLCVENFPAPKTKIDAAHTSHLMTWAREPAGLLLGTSLGLNSLCAHLCSWHTGFSPGAGTGMWFAVCGFVVQSNLQPTLGWREILRFHSWSSIFSGGTLCSCRHLFRRLLLPWPIFVRFQVRISDRLVPVVMRPLNRNSLQLTVPFVRDV
jgi:hypothetical protein